MSIALLLQFLTPVITPLILAVAKKVAPRIPSKAIPIAAPAIGAVLAGIGAIGANNPSNLAMGAVLGMAGVCVREIKDQIMPAKNGGWSDTGDTAK